jgi:taurine dioxygenase
MTPFAHQPLSPFGLQLDIDLREPLDAERAQAFRDLFYREGLLVFRGQSLSEEQQVRVLGHLGRVLGSTGEYRSISSDGNLGSAALCYHSDLSFTAEPFKVISLHATAVNDGQTSTSFANGVRAFRTLPASLRARIEGRRAVAIISFVQSHREIPYEAPADIPQQAREAVMRHPVTGEPILYVTQMQTGRIDGLDPAESEALLQELFAHLYAPENVYTHAWRNGDLVIWDNLALQHARPDLTGCVPRTLQRVCVADKSFFDLCPRFALGDAAVERWASGDRLRIG